MMSSEFDERSGGSGERPAQRLLQLLSGAAGIRAEFASACDQVRAFEAVTSRQRKWLALFLSATIGFAIFAGSAIVVVRRRHPGTFPNRKPTAAGTLATPLKIPETVTADELAAMERFTRDLQLVPSGSIPLVLQTANQWLLASGNKGCVTKTADGEVSLLLGVTAGDEPDPGVDKTPLRFALSRCADAVEQVLGKRMLSAPLSEN